MNLFDLSGKTAIVTGTSGNLGPIWCETLTDAGAHVIGLDYPEFDVSRDVMTVDEPVHILVNNAGIDNAPFTKATFFGNFDNIVDVNLTGATRMTEQVLQWMIDAGGGVIINIGSIQGSVGANWRNYPDGFEKPVGYSCSKAALIQLSRSITTQYGRYNVRSVTIAFGCVGTPKIADDFAVKYLRNVPLGRMISKKSLQTAMLFVCCCPDVAGQLIMIDGGYTAW